MSSSKNPVPKPSEAAISSQPQSEDSQGTSHSKPEPERTAENTMDHQSASTLTTDASPLSSVASSSEQPQAASSASVSASPSSIDESADVMSDRIRLHPIPPASEPMQYRAIGLVKGVYTPSEEQFTRGMLKTEDGVDVDAVLLGRVMSLVKKHLDLEQPHLWVVYPRTRSKDGVLHFQIVGVWEPEKLNRTLLQSDEEDGAEDDLDDELQDGAAEDEPNDAIAAEADDAADDAAVSEPTEAPALIAPVRPNPPIQTDTSAPSDAPFPDLEDGYFSIRGEIIFHSPEESYFIIKIQQSPRKDTDRAKAFQLKLKGVLDGKAIGYFWDLEVRRISSYLEVQKGTMIAMVPPKPRKAGGGGGRRGPGMGGPRRKFGAGSSEGPKRRSYPPRGQGQPAGSGTSDRPQGPRRPTPKPIRRSPDQSSNPNSNPSS